MTCLTPAKKAKYQAYITQWETILANYITSLTGSLSAEGIKRYKFDAGGGEASQSAERYDPKDLLRGIDIAERKIEYYERLLNGQGIVNMQLRRYARGLTC